jgi:hypothetical protein
VELTNFERAVLEKLLAGDEPFLGGLRRQLRVCTIRERTMTGVRFFVELDVDRSLASAIDRSGRFGDVDATIEGLDHGAGFVLLIDDGYLRELEGYSYGEPGPESIGSYELAYHDPERDLEGLA